MYYVPEILRLAAEGLLARPMSDASRAEGHLIEALEIARGQEAKFWELRASLALARLWSSQGRRAEAATLVAPIYGWFTEGFDTLDLKEAKTLLDELGQ